MDRTTAIGQPDDTPPFQWIRLARGRNETSGRTIGSVSPSKVRLRRNAVRRGWHFRVQEVMVSLLRVMAVSFLVCMMLAAAEVHAQDKAEQLRTIERARLRSLVDADVVTARRLHADDFELINPRGGTLSKEQYLRDIASGDLDYLEWEPEEIRVRLYGKSAVIRYKAHLRVSVRRSAGRSVTFWHTDLYEQRKGQWQIVWSHATQLQEQ